MDLGSRHLRVGPKAPIKERKNDRELRRHAAQDGETLLLPSATSVTKEADRPHKVRWAVGCRQPCKGESGSKSARRGEVAIERCIRGPRCIRLIDVRWAPSQRLHLCCRPEGSHRVTALWRALTAEHRQGLTTNSPLQIRAQSQPSRYTSRAVQPENSLPPLSRPALLAPINLRRTYSPRICAFLGYRREAAEHWRKLLLSS